MEAMKAIKWVRRQLALYRNDDGTLRDLLSSDVAALETILAMMEGYDPAKRLPELYVPVRIVWEVAGRSFQTIAKRAFYLGKLIYVPMSNTGNYVPGALVKRWYPIVEDADEPVA